MLATMLLKPQILFGGHFIGPWNFGSKTMVLRFRL